MTIPTRPAPAPPSAANAAAGANASLERLRLQLEQQQRQQEQQQYLQQQQQQKMNSSQKLSIKLPPPPVKSTSSYGIYHQPKQNNNENVATSITRKFPTARYAPSAGWNDTPFDNITNSSQSSGSQGKKAPPPRPPPPKINARKTSAPAPPISPRPPTSVNILSNIFNRKKQAKALQSSRVYGVSSGVSNQNSNNSSSGHYASWNTTSSATTNYNFTSHTFETCKPTSTTTSNEAQLISFDSPPSSPTFTQKSNSDCVSVDSFSSDSNFSSPNNGSASQPESGFEDDFGSVLRSRQSTTSPLDPWETLETLASSGTEAMFIGTAPVRNLNTQSTRVSNDNPLCNGKSLLPPMPSLQMPTIIKPKISQKPKAPKPPTLQSNRQQLSFTAANTTTTTTTTTQHINIPQYSGQSKEVSLFDVFSGKADALLLRSNGSTTDTNQPFGIALYDFDGVEEGDLSFRTNEKIYLLEKVSAEWYRGRTRSGTEGIFPANYIDIKVPLSSTNPTKSEPMEAKHQLLTARCLYNFPAEVDGDLALNENDIVTIYYKINDEWLYGEIDGRLGQFPANFLDCVPSNVPPMPQY